MPLDRFLTRNHLALLGLLLSVMVLRIALVYTQYSSAMDETAHIAAGVALHHGGRYNFDLEHPPLVRYAEGFLPYLWGARIPDSDPSAPGHIERDMRERKHLSIRTALMWNHTEQMLGGSPRFRSTIVTLGRIGNLVFLPILVMYVYCWAALLYGPVAGFAAVLLITFSPTVLAHAGLATTDLSITALLIAVAYHLFVWVQAPTASSAAAAGFWSGLALLAKYSATAYIPIIVMGLIALSLIRSWAGDSRRTLAPVRTLLGHGGVFALTALLIVWAGWRIWPVDPWGSPEDYLASLDLHLAPGSFLNSWARPLVSLAATVFRGWADGFWVASNHALGGHFWQFFLGEVSTQGWWYYFPVALGLKTTLPFLLMIAAAVAVLCRRPLRSLREGSWYALLCGGLVLAIAMSGKLNIGVRHVLALYPFLAVAASCLLVRSEGRFLRSRGLVNATLVLLLAHLASSLSAHPDYLPYFNELGSGREHQLLADSNLDWGQDLRRLGRYLDEQGVDDLYLKYWGPDPPESAGITGEKEFAPEDRPDGWVAISVMHLQGFNRPADSRDYQWLTDYEPRTKIGKAIWVYYIEKPNWRTRDAEWRRRRGDSAVTSFFREDGTKDPAWGVGGAGPTTVEVLSDDAGPLLRVTAKEAMAWMAVIRSLKDLPNAPQLAVMVTARFRAGTLGNVHLYDVEAGEDANWTYLWSQHTDEWQRFTLTRDFGRLREQDSIAVGLTAVVTGDFIEIRDAVILRDVALSKARVVVPVVRQNVVTP